jgi:hypothetical protein
MTEADRLALRLWFQVAGCTGPDVMVGDFFFPGGFGKERLGHFLSDSDECSFDRFLPRLFVFGHTSDDFAKRGANQFSSGTPSRPRARFG